MCVVLPDCYGPAVLSKALIANFQVPMHKFHETGFDGQVVVGRMMFRFVLVLVGCPSFD